MPNDMTLLPGWAWFWPLGAYLLGSVPFGWVIAKQHGINLREVGSGNIGATNVGRALGKKYAVLVLVLDALKGALPVVGVTLVHFKAAAASLTGESAALLALTGLAGVLGHSFSFFLRFEGGKGVATSLGVALAVAPIAALCSFGVYLAVYLPTRISSVGSMSGVVAYPLFLFFLGPADGAVIGLGVALGVIVIVRHRANIQRLLQGRENRA